MKKILLLTYNFPPCNAIAAHRPKSFADHFYENGLYTIVVTRHWGGSEKTWADYEKPNLDKPQIIEHQKYSVIRLPYAAKYKKLLRPFERITLLRKIVSFLLSLFGVFQVHVNTIESFHHYIYEYLKRNQVDYIFVTSDPLNIIKLGYKLSEKFRIPLIVDFRDHWNNNALNKNYRPSATQRFHDYCYEIYLRRWLRNVSLITAVTEPILEETRRLNPTAKTLVVTNGFEKDLFDIVSEPQGKLSAKFTFSLIGTLFPKHDLSVLAEGMKIFLEDKNLEEIQLNFIGTAGIPKVRDFLENTFPRECTLLTERIPRNEALEKMKESDVLFHAGWRNYKGIASGKIFEYLASGKNILIAPGDNDIMEKLVTETRAGKIANSPQEFAKILNDWFDEWKKTGKLRYTADKHKINQYSRENQAKLLALEISKLNETHEC